MKQQIRDVMKALKLTDFTFVLGKTNFGELGLKFIKDQEEAVFTLDSVPVTKDVGKELSKIFGF